MSNLITKRFVIRKSLIGKNVIITFTNKKNEEMSYSHDEVYTIHKDKFESMNCLDKLDNACWYVVCALFLTQLVFHTINYIL